MSGERTFFGHPRGLATLFLVELWERFSYYGMRGLLILFMAAPASRGGMGMPLPEAGAIYGLYTGMAYLICLPGGWVADRILGARRAVMLGGVIIAFGHFCLALPRTYTFFVGLVFVVIGTGLLKPNVSTMVGELYEKNDARRDAAFSIFYMGINIGAFTAPLACSYLGENINWHYGFGLAGIGMTAGVIQFYFGQKHLGPAGLAPVSTPADRRNFRWYGLGGLAFVVVMLILAFRGAISILQLSSGFGLILTATVVIVLAGMLIFGKWTPIERGRILMIVILFAAASLFWSIYEQAGSNTEPVRRTEHRSHVAVDDVPGRMVPSSPGSLRDRARAGVRVDLGEAGPAQSGRPHEVRDWAVLRRFELHGAGAHRR